jgi:nucleoside-diphosphate-sugar epimerase
MLFNIISFAQKQNHLKKLLFPSTSEVYAGTLKYFDLPIPTPEKTPLAITDLKHPRTSYMLSKIYGEALCHAADLPFIIIRPHNIYGPRMGINHVIPELLLRSHKQTNGGELKVYSLNHKRTFCFIDDAIEQIIGLLNSDYSNRATYNIGSIDEEVSIEELSKVILKVTNKKLRIIGIEDTPGSPTRRKPDMNETLKIIHKNNWIKLQDGVEQCYEWYRNNLFDNE